MGVEIDNLRDMPEELHEALFRDLFRAHVLDEADGNTPSAELNRLCMEQIFEAGKISEMRRLDIGIEVLAVFAVTKRRMPIENAAA